MNYTPKQPAYSLVFAFLVMTVIMIVASATIQNTESKVRYFAELEATAQARLAAESAAEKAVTMVRAFQSGYEPTQSGEAAFCEGGTSSAECQSYGNFEIYADAIQLTDNTTGDASFYLPIAGTGTAGLSDECSVLNVDDEPYSDPDHVCNWNKLLYGESATIPLYATDSNGEMQTAQALGISSWSLRLRTPCANGSQAADCDGDDRMQFDTSDDPDEPSGEGSTILLWQVIYDNDPDPTVLDLGALVPDDDKDSGAFGGEANRANSSLNTEVYEDLINDESTDDFTVLDSSTIAGYSGVVDSLESVLQMDIVSTLESTAGETIPYLEWQLQFDSTGLTPFADAKSVFVGEGYYVEGDRIFYFPYVVERSTLGGGSTIYTLSN